MRFGKKEKVNIDDEIMSQIVELSIELQRQTLETLDETERLAKKLDDDDLKYDLITMTRNYREIAKLNLRQLEEE